MMPATQMQPSVSHAPSTGGRLVATDGRALPLVSAALAADCAGGVARVVLEQRFRNPHADPLAVTYSLPLPADGAVSGFAFRIGGRRIVGEVDRKAQARERYERALMEGRSAALVEQDRSSLFTQEIGNIPPGEEIVAEITIDQRLRWLDEGSWEWRFPTVVAPRYLGGRGRVPDADRVTQDVADGPLEARASLRCVLRDALAPGRRPESPSHAVDVAETARGVEVALRDERGARLDRDVVVRWRVGAPAVGLALDAGRPARGPGRRAGSSGPGAPDVDHRGAGEHAAYGLLTVVPPSSEAAFQAVRRDLIVLLDTSGSMEGEPLRQAVAVVSAIVDTLRDEDRLEMIEFSSSARRWKGAAVEATAGARRDAIQWLRGLRASSSTEMREAISEALRGLREGAQRQVVLVTDGQIGFESEVVREVCERLPAASRLHTVGVGSAVNRSLTGPAARAGRGVEVVIGLGEDPEQAAWRIVSRTRAPLVVELELSGSALVSHAPAKLPDLFAGAPALIGVALRPEGGELCVRGRTAAGAWEQRLHAPAMGPGAGTQAAAALYGRELVEDLEMRLAAGGSRAEIDASIERTGLDFQIATRLTSWIAVTQDATVDPRDPLRRERMPHELPHGMSAEGLGLRPARAFALGRAAAVAGPMPSSRMDAMGIADDDEDAPTTTGRRYQEPARAVDQGAAPPPAMPARPASAAPRQFRMDPASGRVPGPGAPPPAPTAKPKPAPAEEERVSSRPMRDEIAPDEKAKKRGGIVDAAKRLFRRMPEEAEGAAAPQERRLRGRITVRESDALIVEIAVEGAPLAWDPAGVVRITLADGTFVEARVRDARSTRAGTAEPGQFLRLCLALRGKLPADPRALAFSSGGLPITVDLA